MANAKTFGPDMRVGSGTWAPPRNVGVSARAYQDLKTILHRELITQIDLEKLTTLEDVRARSQVREVIQGLIVKLDTPLSTVERDRLSREVLHEVFGLGPLEPLLQDVTINDILVNTCKQVYVERNGVLELTNVVFKDDAHLRHIIDKIVSTVGRRVDESSPMCDARLLDGSRVNVIIPPLAVDGPDPVHPPVRQDSDWHAAADCEPHGYQPDFRGHQRCRPGQTQHGYFGRYRCRKDDATERHERLYQ